MGERLAVEEAVESIDGLKRGEGLGERGANTAVEEGEVPIESVGAFALMELLESDTLAVLDGDAPIVREAVGDTVLVELPLTVLEGVKEEVPVPLPVGVAVEEGVGV